MKIKSLAEFEEKLSIAEKLKQLISKGKGTKQNKLVYTLLVQELKTTAIHNLN